MSLDEENQQPVDNRRETKPTFERFFNRYLRVKNQLARELLAEILGTFLLCLIGLSSVAQYKFFARDKNVNFFPVNLAFGLAATVAVLASGKVSGAHLNPAVSFAMLILGRMSILRFVIYCIGQLIGAFLGALVTFVLYLDVLKSYGGSMYSIDTAGIFATYPSPQVSSFGGFFDQVVGTAILLIVILAITDSKNVELPHGTVAILVGLTITMIGTAFAYNCGYALNPARDFGPRLFTLIAGWGAQTFSHANYFFWIPIIGPIIGALVGSLIYTVMIASHWS